ncbi:hypothetical protein [Spiroplasma endosymbiont of Megaselia nigra]|uniref:hypothetical protein n=1 Tax=Spiroplasma endosymbiont of Megaselia nigra TaxID=2478537 RepID=UPI000F85C9B5|nr:hypothetical protein [Spiroplasma endosymbiont of Megaselia nigra]RUO85925.1 hypothetical protein D9R21_06005 [Spiroplasma endosymbiont of Megaselia nigra]
MRLKNYFFAIYDWDDNYLGTYSSYEEIIYFLFGIGPSDKNYQFKKRYIAKVIAKTKKKTFKNQKLKIYKFIDEDDKYE